MSWLLNVLRTLMGWVLPNPAGRARIFHIRPTTLRARPFGFSFETPRLQPILVRNHRPQAPPRRRIG